MHQEFLHTFLVSSHLIITEILCGKLNYRPKFRNENTEAQKV